MKASHLFTLVGAAALGLGAALWWGTRPAARDPARLEAPAISGPALYAATFRDASGLTQPLGRYQDRILVLNFWASWCAPCREEMPAFSRLQETWGARGVQFLGVSGESPDVAARHGGQLGVRYPLWTGGGEVMELSRRLGNHAGVLPHTVLIAPGGRIVGGKVGAYTEQELVPLLQELAANAVEKR